MKARARMCEHCAPTKEFDFIFISVKLIRKKKKLLGTSCRRDSRKIQVSFSTARRLWLNGCIRSWRFRSYNNAKSFNSQPFDMLDEMREELKSSRNNHAILRSFSMLKWYAWHCQIFVVPMSGSSGDSLREFCSRVQVLTLCWYRYARVKFIELLMGSRWFHRNGSFWSKESDHEDLWSLSMVVLNWARCLYACAVWALCYA